MIEVEAKSCEALREWPVTERRSATDYKAGWFASRVGIDHMNAGHAR
jgi:hypothetical protein